MGRFAHRFLLSSLVFVLACSAFFFDGAYAQNAERPLLVVLTDTEGEQNDLPIFSLSASPDSVAAGLSRGLSGTILRVYWMQQNYLEAREGRTPEPAYVLLTNRRGGFARTGFVLGNEEKPDAGYVDVHKDWLISGKFGALDQIVPHELAHVMRRQLAGELRDGGTNQVHALGVRTDRVVAFNEGFAEHLQAVAFDQSPDVPIMRELASDKDREAAIYRRLDAYKKELTARFALAPRMRIGFVAWYSNDEDVLRYHGVRNNAFAREASLPERLFKHDPYRAYLLEGVLPGTENSSPKSLGRLASSEGVIAAFYYQWVMDSRIRARRLAPAFYEPFGVHPDEVTELENTYLKMIEAFYVSKPQTVFEMIQGYSERFPEEKEWIDSLATSIFLGPVNEIPQEFWLANRDFETGTTLFDQFRGLPRTHTFDLNAASLVDLVAVKGVTVDMARRIMAGIPYESLEDISTVEGVTEEIAAHFSFMHSDMDVLREELASQDEETLSISAILRPMFIRGLIVILLSAVLGLMLYVWLRRRFGLKKLNRKRLSWNGFLLGILGSAGGWGIGLTGIGAIGVVTVLCGLPAGLYQLFKGKRKMAYLIIATWLVAALPAAVLTGAWF